MNLSKKILENWFLTSRTVKILKEESIFTLGDLLSIKPSYLLKSRNFGKKSLGDIIFNLNNENLEINEITREWIQYLNSEKLSSQPSKANSSIDKNLLKKVDELKISLEIINCLKENKIIYIGDLVQKNELEMLRIYNFNRQNLNEIKEALSKMSLHFNHQIFDWKTENIDELILAQKNLDMENNMKIINPEDFEKFNINIIKNWPLSARTKHALLSGDIIYLGDLIKLEENDLLKLRNFGVKSIEEIKRALKDFSLSLGMNIGKWVRPLNENNNSSNNDNFFSMHKPLFKNPIEIKKKYFEDNKVIIKSTATNKEVENLIIEDIREIFESLAEKYQIIFKHRLAYNAEYKTLEELAKIFLVTRERIRQLENNLLNNIKFLGKINKLSLVKFLLQNENIGFHKIFSNLDNIFFNTSVKSGKFFNTTGDSLTFFLEMFCGVEKNLFKTPERLLMNFDKEKIKNIFIETQFPILKDFLIEEIRKNYGYNQEVAQSAFEYMEREKLITNVDNKIYPSKINKIFEVSNILRGYPDGLPWKEIILIANKSPTKNKWNMNRKVADHSVTMEFNPYIFLCGRGKYKHIKYLNLIDEKDEIIQFFIKEIKKTEKKEILFVTVYKKVIEENKYRNLDFYEARAIIKIYGEDQGLFHKGRSGNDILNLTKNFSRINIITEIYDFISKSQKEIHIQELEKNFSKNIKNLYTKLHALVDQGKIFNISPGIFINYEDGINMCNLEEVEMKIKEIISNYEFLTSDFLREYLNDTLGYNLSSLYYNTLCRILAKKNSWYYGNNYLSDKSKKIINLSEFVKNNYDHNKDTNENFFKISKLIALSKKSYDMIIYNSKFKFDDSWINN
jgi:DNA-directed RNA polymerase alpha subunit